MGSGLFSKIAGGAGLIGVICSTLAASVQAQSTPTPAAEALPRVVTLATGDVLGTYFALGGRVCEIVNEAIPPVGFDCVVRPSTGSRDNIEALRAGRVDMALMQSDWQYQANEGLGEYDASGGFPTLRALFSLAPISATLVVHPSSGIPAFERLLGKRVNIGPPDSNENKLFRQLMAAMGWTASDIGELSELSPDRAQTAYCNNQLDALFYFTGHPSPTIQRLLTECDSVLVAVDSPFIDGLASEFSYMSFSDIRSGELYGKSPETVRSVGIVLTVAATTAMPVAVAERVTNAVMMGLPQLQALHPSLETVSPSTMAIDGLTAPLHDGAMAAYMAANVPLERRRDGVEP